MDMDKLAGVATPVDEDAVNEEVMAYVTDTPWRRPAWRIENLGAADWAMRKLAEIRSAALEYNDLVERWKAARQRVAAAGEWFEGRLEEWAIRERRANEQRKTFPMAHGIVSTRDAKPRIVVTDETAACVWAEQVAPGLVETSTKFYVSRLKDEAKVTDVIVAWTSTNTKTGEVETIPVAKRCGVGHDQMAAALDMMRDRLGDDYNVEPVTELGVVDKDHELVPGLGVDPGGLSATSKPLMPS